MKTYPKLKRTYYTDSNTYYLKSPRVSLTDELEYYNPSTEGRYIIETKACNCQSTPQPHNHLWGVDDKFIFSKATWLKVLGELLEGLC